MYNATVLAIVHGAPGNTVDRIALAAARSASKNGIAFVVYEYRRVSYWRLTSFKNQAFLRRKKETLFQGISRVSSHFGQTIVLPIGEGMTRKLLGPTTYDLPGNVTLPISSLRAYRCLGDKYSCAKLAIRNGLKVPAIYEWEDKLASGSIYVKPKRDFDEAVSRKFDAPMKFRSLGDAKRSYASSIRDSYFIQSEVIGESTYVCGLFDGSGFTMVFGQKNLTQEPRGGSILSCVPLESVPSEIVRRLELLARSAAYQGPFMAEFRVNSEGWYLIEVNPRFWGPIQLAVDNGFDFFMGYYCLLSGNGREDRNQKAVPRIGYRNMAGYFSGKPIQLGKSEAPVELKDPLFRSDSMVLFFLSCITRSWGLVLRFLSLRGRDG